MYISDAIRLKIVLKFFAEDLGVLHGMLNSVIGVFFSNITPLPVGGQPFQIHHLYRRGIGTNRAANIIVSRRFVKSFLIITMCAVFFSHVRELSEDMHIASVLLHLGLFTYLAITLVLAFLFANPGFLGMLARRIDNSWFGRPIRRAVAHPDWAAKVDTWATALKGEVRTLWIQKPHVVLLDAVFMLLNLFLHTAALAYVVESYVHIGISYFQYLMIFVILNVVAYLVPTPGASGSVESVYALAFIAISRQPVLAASAVLVWRFATYYLHVFFGLAVVALYARDTRKLPG